MTTIWKFPIAPDTFEVELPKGARVLSVQTQGGSPFMWVLVNDQAPKEKRRFTVVGTGHDCEHIKDWSYVGTFQLNGGALVFHLFDGGAS